MATQTECPACRRMVDSMNWHDPDAREGCCACCLNPLPTIRVFATFPFSEALYKQVGEYVSMGGKPYKVLEKVRQGRNEPYFRLEGVPTDHYLCFDGPGIISWQVLGDARP